MLLVLLNLKLQFEVSFIEYKTMMTLLILSSTFRGHIRGGIEKLALFGKNIRHEIQSKIERMYAEFVNTLATNNNLSDSNLTI